MSEGRKRARAHWGTPDLMFGPLHLWVHRYEFPDMNDEEDGNWLVATAEVVLSGAGRAEVSGPFITTLELTNFRDDLVRMSVQGHGSVSLGTVEPELNWNLWTASQGHLETQLEVVGHGHRQQFHFQVEQSHLPRLIRQLDVVLDRFPARGMPHSRP
ncbi:WapI family immunity protein [Deinococcus ficus]